MPLSTDPIDLALDADTRDLIIPFQRTRGVSAVRQGIDIRLGMLQGEWFADRDEGVPWFDNDIVPEHRAILGQAFDEGRVRHEVRKAILDTPGVDPSTLSIQVAYDSTTREPTVDYTVGTAFGDDVSGTFTRQASEV